MKLSDYVIDFLVQRQINEIFTVSGGGIAHLLDLRPLAFAHHLLALPAQRPLPFLFRAG